MGRAPELVRGSVAVIPCVLPITTCRAARRLLEARSGFRLGRRAVDTAWANAAWNGARQASMVAGLERLAPKQMR